MHSRAIVKMCSLNNDDCCRLHFSYFFAVQVALWKFLLGFYFIATKHDKLLIDSCALIVADAYNAF